MYSIFPYRECSRLGLTVECEQSDRSEIHSAPGKMADIASKSTTGKLIFAEPQLNGHVTLSPEGCVKAIDQKSPMKSHKKSKRAPVSELPCDMKNELISESISVNGQTNGESVVKLKKKKKKRKHSLSESSNLSLDETSENDMTKNTENENSIESPDADLYNRIKLCDHSSEKSKNGKKCKKHKKTVEKVHSPVRKVTSKTIFMGEVSPLSSPDKIPFSLFKEKKSPNLSGERKGKKHNHQINGLDTMSLYNPSKQVSDSEEQTRTSIHQLSHSEEHLSKKNEFKSIDMIDKNNNESVSFHHESRPNSSENSFSDISGKNASRRKKKKKNKLREVNGVEEISQFTNLKTGNPQKKKTEVFTKSSNLMVTEMKMMKLNGKNRLFDENTINSMKNPGAKKRKMHNIGKGVSVKKKKLCHSSENMGSSVDYMIVGPDLKVIKQMSNGHTQKHIELDPEEADLCNGHSNRLEATSSAQVSTST